MGAMPRLVTTHDVDATGRDRLLTPRDDVVAEREVGEGRFALAEGPLREYDRSVTVEPGADGRFAVREEIHYRLGIPYWGWLFALPARSALRNWRRPRRFQPWWLPAERLDTRSAAVLGTLAGTALIAGYLSTVVGQTMAFAADEFGATDTDQANALGAVRIGVLVALGIIAVADRRGRRVVMLVAVVAGVFTTATGALAPSLPWLTASQLVSRSFTTTLGVLLAVMVVEEMPKGSRAYGISVVGMSGAVGAGVCVMALPLADLGDRGWRLVYLIPLFGLVLVPGLARRLPESQRFHPERSGEVTMAGHWRRLALIATTLLCINLFVAPASQFRNEYLDDELGWSSSLITAFILITSTLGGIGVFIGGRLADVFGRRLIGATLLVPGLTLVALLYVSSGPTVWLVGFLGTAFAGAVGPALAVYGPELFPSAIRNRANGGISIVQVIGSVIGLQIAGRISDAHDRLAPGMFVLLVGPVAAALLLWRRYPETTRRELEEINPEDSV